MTPELKEICEAYKAYQAQTIPRHLMDAKERLWEAVKAFAKSKGWESWTVDLVYEQESRSCKCNECGDVHSKRGRRPGLYINDKSIQQIVNEEAQKDITVESKGGAWIDVRFPTSMLTNGRV